MTLALAVIALFATATTSDVISPEFYSQAQQIQDQPNLANGRTNLQAQDDRSEKAQSAAKNQKSEKYWKRFVVFVETNDKFVNAISTAVIAAFTLALFVATTALWIAGERHSERELRAYIALHVGK